MADSLPHRTQTRPAAASLPGCWNCGFFRGYPARMRSLLVLAGVLVLLAGAVTWKLLLPAADTPVRATDGAEGRVLLGLPAGEGEPLDPLALARASASAAREAASTPGGRENLPADAGFVGDGGAAPANAPPRDPGGERTPAAAAPPARPLTYRVRSGDSLYRIVMRAYGTAPPDLLAAVAIANRMKDPSMLVADQDLTLPVLEHWPAPKLD